MALRRVDNPPNPFTSELREWLDEPPAAEVEVYEETAKSVLTENDSPDIPFRWSINPYRGCQHACAYCYARPYHEYLGYGAGTDFDTKIVVKMNAPQVLREELQRRAWAREWICFSGVTDCYQPMEAVYKITRGCLEACLEVGNPVSIITKGYLIVRDLELLAKLHRTAGAQVYFSIAFADDAAARALEPSTPPPSRRFEAVRRLADAGIPVGVMIGPVIPGLNDKEIPSIILRAAQAGARSVAYTALRLPGSVSPVFMERLRAALPLRAERVESRIREMRGGQLNDSRFGRRMTGEGEYWQSVKQLFEAARRKHGLVDLPTQSATREDQPRKPVLRSEPKEPRLTQLTFRFGK